MFDQIKNIASMVGQAKQLREHLEQLQATAAQKTVEADAGAGAVRVVANGKMQIVSVTLDQPLLVTLAGQGDEADKCVIEDLITAATNAALDKARQAMQEELQRLGGGIDPAALADLQKMIGGQA